MTPRDGRAVAAERLDAERVDRMLRELASDLADLVAEGALTEAEANEWLARKQDQWSGGDR